MALAIAAQQEAVLNRFEGAWPEESDVVLNELYSDVYKGYGFEAHPVNLSEPMPPEQMAKFWEDFINGHIPNFRKSPYDQIDNYVKDCWTAIVDSDRVTPPRDEAGRYLSAKALIFPGIAGSFEPAPSPTI